VERTRTAAGRSRRSRPGRSTGVRSRFVVIQCIMVGLIIAFPALVSYDKPIAEGQGPQIDIQQMLKDDAQQSAAARRGRMTTP